MTRVAVVGATGKTGNAVAQGLVERDDVELVACVAPSLPGAPTRPVPDGVRALPSLDALDVGEVDVVVDFTHAEAARETLELSLRRGWHVVLGTTGITPGELEGWAPRFRDEQLGLLYAPNFAVGAILMIALARQAAPHMPSVEVIEAHNPAKRDAPSGTATETARQLATALGASSLEPSAASEPALGVGIGPVRVHSMRIDGAVAHQEVVFGAAGQRLTIRHDAFDRSCYVPGVALAVRHVADTPGLTIGLEHLLT